MKIAVLAGGIGGARFLRGVRAACPDDDITAVVNTGDDVTLHGLRICPDLDSVMYTLGGVHDAERGWGRAGRDLADQGRADGLRRRAVLVRARRPRHRHPPRPHPDARRRLLAVRRHGRAVRALAAGRHPRPDVRPALRDARRRRAGRRPAGHPLPGVVGAAPRRAARRGLRAGRRRRRAGRARGAGRDRHRRRRADRAEQPGGVDRDDPRRARHPDGRWRRRRARSSASPPSSAARRSAAWPTPACR